MIWKTEMKHCLILALLALGFAGQTFAQEGGFQAIIHLIGVQPFVIPNFTINEETAYDALRQGKGVKLSFRDLKEIRFLNPGKSFEAEILFNNGRKEILVLQPASDIVSGTEMIATYSHTKVARIEIAPMPAPSAAPDSLSGSPAPSQAAIPSSHQVLLRSGDSLTGQVQMKALVLRSAYGTFQFETAQIASIEFDAKQPRVATVQLRNGDRLNGAIDLGILKFTTATGEVVSVAGNTIQKIHFTR